MFFFILLIKDGKLNQKKKNYNSKSLFFQIYKTK